MNIDKNELSTSYEVFLDRTKNSYDILDSATQHTPIRIYPEKIFATHFKKKVHCLF